METIQEKIEKSFKENSPRIAIKKGEKNTTYSELYNEVKILSFNISNVWPEQRKYLLAVSYTHLDVYKRQAWNYRYRFHSAFFSGNVP